jgi:ABC-type transporter Mla maintaining outer membrane lipid asymmetry ATPase subunit MlaF
MIYKGRIIAEDKPEAFRNHSNPVVAQFISGDTDGPLNEDLPENFT